MKNTANLEKVSREKRKMVRIKSQRQVSSSTSRNKRHLLRPRLCEETGAKKHTSTPRAKRKKTTSGAVTDKKDEMKDKEQPELYMVERLVDKKKVNDGGEIFYLVKWEGYASSDNTWEPSVNLPPEVIQEFENRLAVKVEAKTEAPSPKKRSKSKLDSDSTSNNEFGNLEGDIRTDSTELGSTNQIIKETQNNMRHLGIVEQWPDGVEPVSVEGVIEVDKTLTYVVKRKTIEKTKPYLEISNIVLVHASSFKLLHPELVIAYYEKISQWT